MTAAEQLEQEAREMLEDITRDAITYFEAAITSKGLVLTQELRDSLKMEVISGIGTMQAATVIHFQGYGRYKDMKVLSYKDLMPVEALEKFVERIGVGKFAWIPGYEKQGRTMPITSRAIQRIAAGIVYGMQKKPTVNQGKRHAWYNRTKADFLNVTRRRLLERGREIALKALKDGLERP